MFRNSKNNWEESRILLFSKHYSRAILLFEQAVEKGMKSFGL
jgi:HEPN domain-containing protein